MNTQVLIVGAGPTGLMAANQLMRFGIDFIIVDSKKGPTVESRAIAVTARSLEIYRQMGLSDKVLEQGTRINSFNIYSGGKRKAEVKIGEIGKGLSDFHYLFAFEQSRNEELLYSNLKAHNQDVLWETSFISLKEQGQSVHSLLKSTSGDLEINAHYLIACEGAKSPVRHQLNFKFEGGTYENRFFVADTVMSWDLEYDKLIIAPSDTNFCGFFPLKGEKCYRVLGTLPPAFAGKDDVSFSDIEQVVIKTLGIPLRFEKVNWFSVYKLHHRCVDVFNKGPVFLAGDSAHIHSPAGGQGMNTGLQDAYNLAWKMAFVLKGYAKPELLDTYNEERLPFAQWLMRFTDRAFGIMTSDNWFVAKFRKYIVLNFVGKIMGRKFLRPKMFKTVSQIGYSYAGKTLSQNSSKQALQFTAGDRLPYIPDFYDQFNAPCFHLLRISENFTNREPIGNLDILFPFPVKAVNTLLTESWKKLGVEKELFILIRPDNYIAFISDALNAAEIHGYLAKRF